MSKPDRVLVLDARPEFVRPLEEACRALGQSCVESHWPLPRGLANETFGLIVIDAATGGGERVVRILRALRESPNTNATPCLVVCERPSEGELDALVYAGADDFFGPDIAPAELQTRLRLHLGLRLSAALIARRERALSVMLEITETLVSTTDVQEILYTVVRRIADVVHVDRVSIVLVPDDNVPYGYVMAASDDAALSNLRVDLNNYPEIQHVLAHKTPLTIGDVITHPVLDGVRSSVTGLGLTSLTLIPMVFAERVMGVLFLRAQHKLGALDAQQIGFCQVLANATAIALCNARILQTLHDGERDFAAPLEAEKRLALLKRYADVFESAADGIAALDEEAHLLYANPGAYNLLGYEESDFPIGSSVYELLEDRHKWITLQSAFERNDFPRNLDVRVRRKGGDPIVISCSFSRLHSQDSAVLLSFRDVTEARRTQEELVQTRNFLQSLIDASVDAIVASDMTGTIILFNAGAQRLYGHAPEDVLQKMNVKALYPGDGAREVGRMLKSRARGGVGRLEPVRMEAVDKQGNVFPISLTAATIYENGAPVATFGIFADLRERVRVEEQLAQAQAKLAISEKQSLVAELAGATAHELNQPLTSVMGYAELLLRKIDEGSPAYRAASIIQSEAQRMAEIVRKIGKLTRYETKSYVGEQRILDLDRASEDDPKSGPGSTT
ncbi:MAG TPA: PAS domain S-box protein [Polyangiales bacterium]